MAAAEATSSDIWLILDSVRTLKVEIIVVRLHLRSRCLGSVADFSNTELEPGPRRSAPLVDPRDGFTSYEVVTSYEVDSLLHMRSLLHMTSNVYFI